MNPSDIAAIIPSRPWLNIWAGSYVIALIIAAPASVQAANVTWKGSTSTNFETNTNWNGNAIPADNLTSSVALFSGNVTSNQPRLTISRKISGLLFSTATGGWTLSGSSASNVLTIGSSGISTAGQASGTNTISAGLSIGAAQAWQAGTGGTLLFTGSLTGTSGFSTIINAGSNKGNVVLSPGAGNSIAISGSNSSASLIQVKTGGLLVLGGDGLTAPLTTSTNFIQNTAANSSYGTWGITGGGAVQVNSGEWITSDLGKNGSDAFSGAIEVKGGMLSFTGARYLSSGTLAISGGALKVTGSGSNYTNGGRFSLGASTAASGTAILTISDGLLDLAQSYLGNSIGSALSTRATQSGGLFQNGVTIGGGLNGGTDMTFSIGGTNANVQTAYTLTGGTFVSAGTVQAGGGAGPDGVNNFNFNGGTMVVAAFNATNLGCSTSGTSNPVANSTSIGTLTNNGGTLAPGGIGTPGSTFITGNYAVNSGTFAVDVGGTTQASAFQYGQHDFLVVSGTVALGGNLFISTTGTYTPQNSDIFTILAGGTVTGVFSNVPFNSRVAVASGSGSFLLSTSGTSVILSQYESLAPPIITVQPTSLSLAISGSGVFTVAAGSFVTPTYQWRKDGVPISGGTNASYAITAASMAQAGNYDVVVTNPVGSVTSNPATLTVATFGSDVLGERSITYNYTGVRPISSVSAAGVHPRIYFNGDELPAIRDRLANTAVGQEAFKMIKLYTDLMRRGRSLAYDTQPASFKTMPDGTPRINNVGLYDKSANYNLLVGGTVSATVVSGSTSTPVGVANDTSTGNYVLAGEMALEAFECLVLEGQPGIAARAGNLAAALDTWASWVLTLSDFPGPAGATFNNKFLNQDRFGGHLNALTYDMIHNSMTQPQRDNVRKALARLMGGYFASDNSNTEYTGVGCAPEAVATNHVAINSFKLITACAIEGEVTATDAGYSAADLDAWFKRAMGSYHKFLTYGWFASGAPLEGQGKNYLYGAHMIPLARRGYDFFGHPYLRAYMAYWLPAIMQPFGYAFLEYDLLGGSGSNPERGRQFIESLDYTALKWMFPNDNAADFAWRNYVRTEYKDGSGNWQTFLDLRDGKFDLRSVYHLQLLPAAIFASDIASTATWTQQNAEVQGPLDYLDALGGTLVARSGYDADSTALVFHVRQDFGGHTFADRNAFTLSALGRLFINYNSGSTNSGLQGAALQSVVEVDGTSMLVTDKEGDKLRIPSKLAAWSPTGGVATFATGDATYAYSQEWWWNAYTTGGTTLKSGFVADYNTHNTFRRAGNKIPESFGNTPFVSFPHWEAPGQFEGIQAKSYNPMRQVYRTIGLVRGVKPYALVIDDLRKDNATHSYRWLASIPQDLTLLTGTALPAGADPATDAVLQESGTTGNRRLLVRVLNAAGTPVLGSGTTTQPSPGVNITFSAPQEGSSLVYSQILSNTNTNESWKRIVIERAGVVAPDFRVLLFPFRSGDALPTTSLVGNTLTFSLSGQTDTFTFQPRTAVVGGQSVTMNEFTLSRNGTTLVDYRNQIEPVPVRGPSGILDTLPNAPTSLTATVLSETQVRLNWTDNATNETAYVVERSSTGTGNWTPLATTLAANSVSFTDASATPAASYDYRVRCSGSTGLSNYANVTVSTPAGVGDGIPGWWRYMYFGNGTSIIPGVSGLADDYDKDGMTTQQEYIAGTNPVDANSAFRITEVARVGNNLLIRFPTVSGKLYALDAQSVLTSGSWSLVIDNIPGTGGTVSVTATNAISQPQHFYRVRVEP